MTKAQHAQMVAIYRVSRRNHLQDMELGNAPYTRMDNIKSIDLYVEHQIPTGDFLRAVIENNLSGAFGRADSDNTLHMEGIVSFIYNCMPRVCRDFNGWLNTELTEE